MQHVTRLRAEVTSTRSQLPPGVVASENSILPVPSAAAAPTTTRLNRNHVTTITAARDTCARDILVCSHFLSTHNKTAQTCGQCQLTRRNKHCSQDSAPTVFTQVNTHTCTHNVTHIFMGSRSPSNNGKGVPITHPILQGLPFAHALFDIHFGCKCAHFQA